MIETHTRLHEIARSYAHLSADIRQIVETIMNGIVALATLASDSNGDSNSPGGIPIHTSYAIPATSKRQFRTSVIPPQ
jgi:hypothetical protein